MNSRWSADSSTNDTTAERPAGRAGQPGQARVVEPHRDLRGEVLELVAGQSELGEDDQVRAARRAPRRAARGGSRGWSRAPRAAGRSGRARSVRVCTLRSIREGLPWEDERRWAGRAPAAVPGRRWPSRAAAMRPTTVPPTPGSPDARLRTLAMLPAGRRGRRGRMPRSRSTRELVSRSTGSRHRRPPDRRRAAAGGVQRDGPADRHEPADAVPSPGHPGPDARTRSCPPTIRPRATLRAARRQPPDATHAAYQRRAQAHPGDRRDDRHLRAVPARRRLPDEDRVTGLRDQRRGLDRRATSSRRGGRAGHRQRGQRDRTVPARALGPRHGGQPGAQRRLLPRTAPPTSG